MIDNNEGTVDLLMDGTLLPGVEKYENGPERIVNNDAFTEIRDDFDKEELDVAWNFVRAEDREMYSLNERPGMLRLTGKAVQLSDVDVPAFICRRQQHVHMQLTASVYFEPNENGEEAGLAARYDEKNHYVISVKRMENNRFVVAYKVSDGEKVELGRKPLEDAQVYLRLSGNAEQYEFHYSTDEGKSWKNLGQAPAVQLTAQRNGGFTGVCIGMYATGNGQQSTTPAWFDWVHYEGVN